MGPQRRLTFDLDLNLAHAVLRNLGEPSPPVGFRRLHGGSTEVYRIDLAGPAPPLVLKIYCDEPEWAPAKEQLVASWIGDGLGEMIPRWLQVDATRAVLPLRYALMTWLPGRPVRSLMSESDIERAYRHMGALLRRVHTIPMNAYGYVLGDGVSDPRNSNADYMVGAFDRAFRRFREKGGDPDLARLLEAAVRERFDLLAESEGP